MVYTLFVSEVEIREYPFYFPEFTLSLVGISEKGKKQENSEKCSVYLIYFLLNKKKSLYFRQHFQNVYILSQTKTIKLDKVVQTDKDVQIDPAFHKDAHDFSIHTIQGTVCDYWCGM